MSPTLSTALDVHLTIDSQTTIFFSKRYSHHNPSPKRFTILCKSSKKSLEPTSKSPSLSDQLKPLSSTVLSTVGKDQPKTLSNPKSIWVNPTKPRRAVVDPERQRRSQHSDNPNVKELRAVTAKLNAHGSSDDDFMAVLDELPQPVTRGTALLVLNNLRPWQKAYMFFNWLKTQDSLPMETIFYNVIMKSLRYGFQFELTEQLGQEMVSNGIELDNITYSTIISCAKKCNYFDKAVEWFERMYRTGLMPDEVTYSAVLDVYAQLGKVEEVLSLYERGRANGWKPDVVAFAVLLKMYGDAGDMDGIEFVLQEMRAVDVKPNVVVYNTLLEAIGKTRNPGLARSVFEEMLETGITPSERTLTSLVKIYGKARWARDALELWERLKVNNWPVDFILYNTLLSMCADTGLEDEAEELFQDMKDSGRWRPDAYTHAAMLKVYASVGKDNKGMELFEMMCDKDCEINEMACTSLIQCLGKAGRVQDLVRVFDISMRKGVIPDDKLCGSLLSVVALCDRTEDVDDIVSCLNKANPKLFAFMESILDERISLDTLTKEFKDIMNETEVDARTPFCNCFIDICRKRNLPQRAHDLLYLGTVFGLYTELHKKSLDEWCLDVRSLSIGAAQTAFEDWVKTLTNLVERGEGLPEFLVANAGSGTQGVAAVLGSCVEELGVPFRQSEDKSGCFVASRDDILSWVQSKTLSALAA